MIDAVGQFLADLGLEGVDLRYELLGELLDEFEGPLVADRAGREVVVSEGVGPLLVAGLAEASSASPIRSIAWPSSWWNSSKVP